jgi:hypothetical protein
MFGIIFFIRYAKPSPERKFFSTGRKQGHEMADLFTDETKTKIEKRRQS